MFRGIRPVPMLLYFAWPIAPMVPERMKPQLLWQIQALGQTTDPPTVLIVANWVLAAQFALQVRLHVPVQRPHGLYVNQSYSPILAPNGHSLVLVSRMGQWARQSGIALVQLMWAFIQEERKASQSGFPFELVFLSIRLRGVEPILHVTYAELSQFHACIFWPWDVMMLLFNELYTMTTPLLVPDRHWLHTHMIHALKHTVMNWWHLRADTVAGVMPTSAAEPFPLPHDPWIDKQQESGLLSAAYWLQLTDFEQFPHVTRFHSLPNMLQELKALDVTRVRAGMRALNDATLRSSMEFYRGLSLHLLS